jgi:hypothetical protein
MIGLDPFLLAAGVPLAASASYSGQLIAAGSLSDDRPRRDQVTKTHNGQG